MGLGAGRAPYRNRARTWHYSWALWRVRRDDVFRRLCRPSVASSTKPDPPPEHPHTVSYPRTAPSPSTKPPPSTKRWLAAAPNGSARCATYDAVRNSTRFGDDGGKGSLFGTIIEPKLKSLTPFFHEKKTIPNART
jgi:hypothetical protein